MKCILLVFSLIFVATGSWAEINYQLDISLQPKLNKLVATATIDANIDPGTDIIFRLDKSCSIVAIHQAGNDLAYRFLAGQLKLKTKLAGPISISYTGRFNDSLENSPAHSEDPSYGISASISPAGTFLSSGVDWYPRLAGEQIHYLINVHSPPDTLAITSGRRLRQQTNEGESLSTWEIDYPLHGITLSAGHFQIFADRSGAVPIYAYFYPESAALAPNYLQEARNYLDLYQELFGPYPFHKFAIVENFFPTGYGLPSWTLLGSRVIALPFIVKTSLGHEIAHSWWGNGVWVDYAQGNWAEGLTTYVADYLFQERSGASEALAYRQKILREFSSLVNAGNDLPLNQFLARDTKANQAIGYGKAAMVFHMLRTRIGEKHFWQGLRIISTQKLFSEVGWETFDRVFSELSGQDLQPFFQQWLSRNSGPRLHLEGVQLEHRGNNWVVTGKLVQQLPAYSLQVDLLVSSDQADTEKSLSLVGKEASFTLVLATRPSSLVVDPQANLFRLLAEEEIPSTVNMIRGSEKLLVLTAERNAPEVSAQRVLLGGLRKSGIPVRTVAESSQNELAANDLLIFGANKELSPEGSRITNSANLLQFSEVSTAWSNQAVFIVTRNPFNPHRHAAWFVTGDSEHAEAVARKIPHYGKFSFLLFEKDTNRKKEIWEPQQSPLRIKFP